MNMITKLTTFEATATQALTIQSQINVLTSELEELKEELRRYGRSGSIPGIGKVTVCKPVESSSKTVLTGNYDVFSSLDPKVQAAILASGSVKVEVKTTSARKASVKLEPNV